MLHRDERKASFVSLRRFKTFLQSYQVVGPPPPFILKLLRAVWGVDIHLGQQKGSAWLEKLTATDLLLWHLL